MLSKSIGRTPGSQLLPWRFCELSNPQPSPPRSLITVCASLSSCSPANLECRRWSTYASYCAPPWREPPNRGPTDRSVSTVRDRAVGLRLLRKISIKGVISCVPDARVTRGESSEPDLSRRPYCRTDG